MSESEPNQAKIQDWREEAEARGRAAFEAAVTEPTAAPAEPLAWLAEYPTRKRNNEE